MCLFLSFCVGCGKQSAQTSPPQGQKLTLRDLRPTNAYQFQPQIVFEIVTFELPTARVKEIKPALAPFIPTDVQFGNEELFSKNGLCLFRGKGENGDKLTSQLRFLEAKRTMRTSLITMDKTGELFSTGTFFVERYVFVTSYGDQTTGQAFLPGQIGWMITAAMTLRRDVVQVKMAPVYAPLEGSSIRLASGRKEYGEMPFEQGRFELTIREGDFLVLAPGRVPTETTLDRMLFGSDGKKDKMRLYVIIFVGAGQG